MLTSSLNNMLFKYLLYACVFSQQLATSENISSLHRFSSVFYFPIFNFPLPLPPPPPRPLRYPLFDSLPPPSTPPLSLSPFPFSFPSVCPLLLYPFFVSLPLPLQFPSLSPFSLPRFIISFFRSFICYSSPFIPFSLLLSYIVASICLPIWLSIPL